MKKLNYLFMALLMSAAVVVTSCGKDEEPDPGPTLSLKGGANYISSDITVQLNTTAKVGVNGLKSTVSGSKLVRFKFSLISNNVSTTFVDSTFNSDSFTWETPITLSSVGEGRLLFELWDKNGMRAEQAFNITVEDPGSQINKYLNVEFGSWDDAIGSFFSSTEGITYTVGQTRNIPGNQAKIDFLFFHGTTNANTVASPDDADAGTINDLGPVKNWTNKNQTRFNPINMTADQFDQIGETFNFPTFNMMAQDTKMNNLAKGHVFLFKTQSGKLGLVKVVDLYKRGYRAKLSIIVQK